MASAVPRYYVTKVSLDAPQTLFAANQEQLVAAQAEIDRFKARDRAVESEIRRLLQEDSQEENQDTGGEGPLSRIKLPLHDEISQQFVFVLADAILSWPGKTMPTFRELHRSHPHVLVRKTVTLSAVLTGELIEEYSTVSHRWMSPQRPDADGSPHEGAQLMAVQELLRANPRIKFVWFDDWCMWQGERSEEEQEEFIGMLKQVNLLSLGTTVFILLDKSYDSRFWTMLEAWCAMQKLTSSGVKSETGNGKRFLIKCIYNAASQPEVYANALIDLLKDKTPDAVHAVLSQPDVSVTNGRDKEIQLPKLGQLDSLVATSFARLLAGLPSQKEEAEAKMRAAQAQVEENSRQARQLAVEQTILEAAAALGMPPMEMRRDLLQPNPIPLVERLEAANAQAREEQCKVLKQQGKSCKEAKQAGYSCKEARKAGYSCAEARQGGYSIEEARQAGWTSRDISCAELKVAGKSCAEGGEAGGLLVRGGEEGGAKAAMSGAAISHLWAVIGVAVKLATG